MTLRIGSMFSGYGGLDLAVEQVLDAEPVWFVEYDAAPAKVLARHWPDVPNYGDVTAVDWERMGGDASSRIDILTAGYP
nr:DNA cytosine methyltransferase [Corynebacterium pygosceleis]